MINITAANRKNSAINADHDPSIAKVVQRFPLRKAVTPPPVYFLKQQTQSLKKKRKSITRTRTPKHVDYDLQKDEPLYENNETLEATHLIRQAHNEYMQDFN